ncbi:MAG: TrkA family potassium uptake protein [Niameybacter sp.]|uniref:potassium channel family protein n=1 Tax=Niameybacter sp. TaxID=2033640 RepID=UPI002FC9D88E
MFKSKKTVAIGIIGLGRFGMALAKRLCELGKEVLVIDQNESKVKELRSHTQYAFVANELTKEVLEEAGIQNCEVVVVCIGEKIDVSILTTLNVVSLGVPKVIAKAISYEQGCVLEKIGAEVVYPERDMALRVAKKIVSHNVLDYISLSNEVELSEIKVNEKLIGQTVSGANLRKQYGLNIIAIGTQGNIETDIAPDYVFKETDVVVVIGKKESISAFEMD